MDAKLIAQFPDQSFSMTKQSYPVGVENKEMTHDINQAYEDLCESFIEKHGNNTCIQCNVTIFPLYPPLLTVTSAVSEDCNVFVSKPAILCTNCIEKKKKRGAALNEEDDWVPKKLKASEV